MPMLIEEVDLPAPRDDREARYSAAVIVEPTAPGRVRAELRLSRNGKPARLDSAEVDLRSGFVAVTGAEVIVASKYLICLGGCGLSHLVKEIMACRRAGQQDFDALLRCLKEKLGALADDLVACAAGCLVTV
jgi:hypothetical protein